MSIHESILVALFVMAIVFIVLIALSLFLSLQSSFFNSLKDKKALNIITPDENTLELSTTGTDFSNVDEKTVAIIIASISYASNTPLNSLKIKSIKPLDL
ncbi:OadG family transporter subunit [uncultured Clostridium sp.]|uniref:OadG family transporter subunit n=1 Tax=uncultured Clostridium sp. TaxID=59620 RepID=UPI0028EE3DA2|nr:OadG family transporter subunit [uncultured Clostridium sp.]